MEPGAEVIMTSYRNKSHLTTTITDTGLGLLAMLAQGFVGIISVEE